MSRTSKDEAQLPVFGERRGGRAKSKPVAERYALWRRTPEGAAAAVRIAGLALERARLGENRIALNKIFEDLRTERHMALNNSFRSFLARELMAQYPQLKDRIEVRTQTSKKGQAA